MENELENKLGYVYAVIPTVDLTGIPVMSRFFRKGPPPGCYCRSANQSGKKAK